MKKETNTIPQELVEVFRMFLALPFMLLGGFLLSISNVIAPNGLRFDVKPKP